MKAPIKALGHQMATLPRAELGPECPSRRSSRPRCATTSWKWDIVLLRASAPMRMIQMNCEKFIDTENTRHSRAGGDYSGAGYCSFGERCSFVHDRPGMDDMLAELERTSATLGCLLATARFAQTTSEDEEESYSLFEEGVFGPPSVTPHSGMSSPTDECMPHIGVSSSKNFLSVPTASSGYSSGSASRSGSASSPVCSPLNGLPMDSFCRFASSPAGDGPWVSPDTDVSPILGVPSDRDEPNLDTTIFSTRHSTQQGQDVFATASDKRS